MFEQTCFEKFFCKYKQIFHVIINSDYPPLTELLKELLQLKNWHATVANSNVE